MPKAILEHNSSKASIVKPISNCIKFKLFTSKSYSRVSESNREINKYIANNTYSNSIEGNPKSSNIARAVTIRRR